MTTAMRFIEFMDGLRDGTVTVVQDYEKAPHLLVVTNADGTSYRLNLKYLGRQAFTQMLIYADERRSK